MLLTLHAILPNNQTILPYHISLISCPIIAENNIYTINPAIQCIMKNNITKATIAANTAAPNNVHNMLMDLTLFPS